MKRSLTTRCLFIFLLLDLALSPLLAFALSLVIGEQRAISYLVAAAFAVAKIPLWAYLANRLLSPYERFHRQPPAARTKASLFEADQAVAGFPLRFAAAYSISWSVSYCAAALSLWTSGDPGRDAREILLLVMVTIAVSAFAFAFPLATNLSTEASNECSLAASEQGVTLERAPMSLQLRIGVVAACVGLAPALWMTAVGYQKQAEAENARAQLVARLTALDLSRTSEAHDATAAHEAAARSIVRASSEGATAFLLAPDGTVLDADPVHFAEVKGDLADLATHAARSKTEGVLTRPGDERAWAFVRTAGGAVAVAAATPGALPASFAVHAALFVLLVMLWAPLSAMLLGKVVSEPITRLTTAMRLVVEEGKLTSMGAVPIAREDEVGELTVYFNQVLALMRALAEAANAVAQGDLLVNVEGVGDLPNAFRGMLENLSAVVRQIRGSSIELASAAAEIFAAAQEQESAATAQSSAMVEISRTMESLSLSAAHVSEAVSGVLGNAERTLKNTDDMVDRIGSLTRHAGRIGEILEVIRDISDRSDLLALNGSLEASRAGESGRGFALVAGEMRRLAERVTASVQDVKKLVTDIRDSGSSTVIATEESRKLADGTTEAARQITFVSQQQRSGTEQVSQSVKNIAEVVSQAASATSEIRTAAEGLKTHADRLADVVRKFGMQAEEHA
jgi:methyl-accepting chemotaxis protein